MRQARPIRTKVKKLGSVLAVGFCLAFLLGEGALARDRAAAREAFRKASTYYTWLQEQPESQRTARRYEQAIFLFRKVIDADPTYGAADDSVYHVALLYDQMAARFSSERSRRRAVYYYEFVAREYPATRHRQPALRRAAELKQVAESPSRSAPASSDRAASNTATPAARESGTSGSGGSREAAAPIPTETDTAAPAGRATLSEVRYWSNEDYTRVVLQLDRETEFQKEVLLGPDRIYFDLENTRMDPRMTDQVYEVNGLFIKQIRIGENRPGVTRVVLDFDQISQHTVFALYDPYRIVIDTRGEGMRSDAARRTLGSSAQPEGTPEAGDPIPPPAGPVPAQQAEAGNQPPSPPVSSESPEPAVPGQASAASVSDIPPVSPEPADAEPAGEAMASASPTIQGNWTLTRALGLKVGRVVIDPGHGGKDAGTIGRGGLREKDVVLAVSLKLRDLLVERLGVEVIMTRSDDRFIPLEERTAIANQKGADLFISVHANASRNRNAFGIETYVLDFATTEAEIEVASRENAGSQRNIRELEDLLRKITKVDYNRESRDLAQIVQRELVAGLSTEIRVQRDRGVKQAPFIVLIGANMPSILTEIGFISNPADEKLLRTRAVQEKVAESLYQGIEGYFRSLGVVPNLQQATASGR